jgi:DNA-binding response OmpR family regulator
MLKKILMVEDDEFLNKVYEAKLSGEDFQMYHVYRGDEVMKQALEVKPDLIVLDIILPGKDGFDVLKELKSDKRTKDIPVMVLTNLSEEVDKQKLLNLGAKTFATKVKLTISEVVEMIKGELKEVRG